MRALRLILLGAPGSGKGTQANRLAERYGFTALSSGHLLRSQVAAETDLGKQADEYMKTGQLVPDDIITGVMLAGIGALPDDKGFILDGFPRTVPQAEALDCGLADAERPIDGVLDFRIDDALIVRRITGRRSCNNCGATYNTEFLPPKAADTCDVCSARLVQRADDRENVVVTRLETYRVQSAPLATYYSERGSLRAIDASGSADEVTAAVVAAIASWDRSE